jgi:hypothetical protein
MTRDSWKSDELNKTHGRAYKRRAYARRALTEISNSSATWQ